MAMFNLEHSDEFMFTIWYTSSKSQQHGLPQYSTMHFAKYKLTGKTSDRVLSLLEMNKAYKLQQLIHLCSEPP